MRRAVALPVAAALLAGCGASVIQGSGRHLTAAPTSGATTPSSSPPAPRLHVAHKWHVYTDRPTGIRFALPGMPRLTRKSGAASDGTPVEKRLYQFNLAPGYQRDFELSVAIVSGKHVPVTYEGTRLRAIPAALVKQFRAAGAADFKILEERPLSVDGERALDFRISFTPLDSSVDKAVWFFRVIADGRALVLIQTIGFPPPGRRAVYEPQLRALHARVCSSVRL